MSGAEQTWAVRGDLVVVACGGPGLSLTGLAAALGDLATTPGMDPEEWAIGIRNAGADGVVLGRRSRDGWVLRRWGRAVVMVGEVALGDPDAGQTSLGSPAVPVPPGQTWTVTGAQTGAGTVPAPGAAEGPVDAPERSVSAPAAPSPAPPSSPPRSPEPPLVEDAATSAPRAPEEVAGMPGQGGQPAGPLPTRTPPAAAPEDEGAPVDLIDLSGDDGARGPLPVGGGNGASDARARREATSVRGVRCRNGHLNHPQARLCPLCGDNMQNQSLAVGPDGRLGELGPRPPLGVLTFDDGSVFQLSRNLVIGRSPSPDAGDDPAPVDDTSVSRDHVRIHLDGWEVHIEDLGSSNGTAILSPGGTAYVRLAPRRRVALASGTVLTFGRRWATYEATSAVPRPTRVR